MIALILSLYRPNLIFLHFRTVKKVDLLQKEETEAKAEVGAEEEVVENKILKEKEKV